MVLLGFDRFGVVFVDDIALSIINEVSSNPMLYLTYRLLNDVERNCRVWQYGFG